MNPLNAYEINAPDVIAETFDGEPVILNLADGRYFSLSGIASSIWPLLRLDRIYCRPPAALVDCFVDPTARQ